MNSGSEANDLAVLMARSYTGYHEVLSLQNCYHGMTYQTMALTCNPHYKYPVLPNPGFTKVTNPDVYKGPWGGQNCRDSPVQLQTSCTCTNECKAGCLYLKEFQDLLECQFVKPGIAAFFAESIQGVGGAVQFPRNYLKGVFGLVKSFGGVFVSDEVQTGFGRTGEHFWGFESHGIVPDIVTMAKGIGNGFPLAAVATTEEIALSLTKATHFNTFGGNPVSCTVGMTVLDVCTFSETENIKNNFPSVQIIEEEGLQENSKTVGTYLLEQLAELRDENQYVGDVRGKGLMIGVELVADKVTKKPLEPLKFMKLWEQCLEQGLIVGKGGLYGNVSSTQKL